VSSNFIILCHLNKKKETLVPLHSMNKLIK